MGEAETLPGLCQSQLFGVTSSLSVLVQFYALQVFVFLLI